jgi:hypothetical protein
LVEKVVQVPVEQIEYRNVEKIEYVEEIIE